MAARDVSGTTLASQFSAERRERWTAGNGRRTRRKRFDAPNAGR